MGNDVLLRTEGLGKRYGALVALDDVSFEVRRATIHGLLGENGAGKSTLVGLVSGQRAPSAGRILLDGEAVEGRDVRAMEAAGVFLVTQEPMIVEPLSAAENLLLGRWPVRGGLVDWRALRVEAARILDGSAIDPDCPAGQLRAVDRRKLNILRALHSGGRLLILDEPTAALTTADRQVLFDFMRELRGRGITFIFISHYNEEILDICDGVTVLRDGRLAGTSDDVRSLSSDALSELVLGRGLALYHRERLVVGGEAAPPAGEDAIVVAGARAPSVAVDRFAIRPGEVVGFAGLPGSGAKEFAEALFGANRASAGSIRIRGVARPLPADQPAAYAAGIAYLSDDRRRDGLVSLMSIGDNLSLSSLRALSRWFVIRRDAEAGLVRRMFRSMAVKAAGPEVSIDTLSGGNQQKVCLGRVLATEPALLILDEPTRGIDVGVKEDVHALIDRLTREGLAVIVVTTDLDEMARVTDRVCIFDGGRIAATLAGAAITASALREVAFATDAAAA